MRRLDNFIGGESLAPKSGAYFNRIISATAQPFAKVAASNVAYAVAVTANEVNARQPMTPSQRSGAPFEDDKRLSTSGTSSTRKFNKRVVAVRIPTKGESQSVH